MKPTLHIIRLNNRSLDKRSLGLYKLLIKADFVWVWSTDFAEVQDMLQNGIKAVELIPGANGGSIIVEEYLAIIKSAISSVGEFKEAILALPGFLLAEGELVQGIKERLTEVLINTDVVEENCPIENLTVIMAKLRSGRGCPWDLEQTHESLRKYLVEEAYEVLDAIDSKNMNNLCEELGDLLLQVVFHARIAEESGFFSLNEVIQSISEKLIRRHPHVFGSVTAESSEEVITNWDAIKKSEKQAQNGDIGEVEDFFKLPRGLPALMMAEEAQKKAGKIGFDWDGYQGPLAKIYEELTELEQEIRQGQREQEEIGDLLFSVVNLSRFLGVNAEEALRLGTKKFQDRFNKMTVLMEQEGHDIEDMSIEEMDIYWKKAKFEEKYGTFSSF